MIICTLIPGSFVPKYTEFYKLHRILPQTYSQLKNFLPFFHQLFSQSLHLHRNYKKLPTPPHPPKKPQTQRPFSVGFCFLLFFFLLLSNQLDSMHSQEPQSLNITSKLFTLDVLEKSLMLPPLQRRHCSIHIRGQNKKDCIVSLDLHIPRNFLSLSGGNPKPCLKTDTQILILKFLTVIEITSKLPYIFSSEKTWLSPPPATCLQDLCDNA